MEELLRKVLEKIKPTKEENAQLQRSMEVVKRFLESVKDDYSFIDIVFAGSSARGTHLRGSSDLDVFLLYPRDVPVEKMEEEIKDLAGRLSGELRYAQHPYLRTVLEGMEVEVVPAYKISPGERVISATDRTPLHNDYVRSHLTERQKDEVRLLKAFMKGIGVYGAEIKVEGFSGYLCELLIIYYGDFISTLRAASRWKWGQYIDIEGHGEVRERRPLVVVDPVDPRRNVAHTVSRKSMAMFIVAAREFLKNPSDKFFFPRRLYLLPSQLREIITERRTRPVLVVLKYPVGASPDNVWGQLKRSAKLLRKKVEMRDNIVIQAETWTDEKKWAFILLEVAGRYTARLHIREGPPATDEENASRFVEKHRKDRYGPYVDERGRLIGFYTVEQKSLLIEVFESMEEIAKEGSVGGELGRSIASWFDVVEGLGVLRYYRVEGFPEFLSHFFLRKFPWEL